MADRPIDLVLIAANAMREAGLHPCAVEHISWRFMGGRSCCCDLPDGSTGECSVPVHICDFCGDSDYGDNVEADEIIAKCERQADALANAEPAP